MEIVLVFYPLILLVDKYGLKNQYSGWGYNLALIGG